MAMGTLVILVIALTLNCYLVEGTYPPPGHSLGKPWPLPQEYSTTGELQNVRRDAFRIEVNGSDCNILRNTINRYYKIIFADVGGVSVSQTSIPVLPSLSVQIKGLCNDSEYPSLNMDESYSLTVKGGVGLLTSQTIWGAMRGLETFSQIVYQDDSGMLLVNGTTINDYPRFSFRGVLLDTSRHFIPKEFIFANLEAMSYNKMNVFHWHIVDDPSFPYESRTYPDLSLKGAYNPQSHVYTQEDVKDIIEFARLRGIRVVPEFDTPGHTQSWGKGQPNLLTPCYKSGQPTGTFGPIDPTVNSTYDFLRGLMKELSIVFPDNYFHLGGDEVSFSCWQSNPNIGAFMKKMGFGNDYSKLEQFYEQNLLDIVNQLNHGYIVWQEIFDNKVKVRNDTVVHVWKGGWQAETSAVTKAGFKTILSSPWYLNRVVYGPDWDQLYAVDPTSFEGSEQQKSLVMGGEACIWGEFVDGSNLIQRFWPRASAVAERLWSAESVKDKAAANPRIEEQRCRMLKRGISAEPPNGPGFCNQPIKYHGPIFN